jgi:glycosyltransferase involved in cell wall biosynthesis
MSKYKKEKKKVLNIVEENSLHGGIGTVMDYLTEGVNDSKDFESDSLFTRYSHKKHRPGKTTLKSNKGIKVMNNWSANDLEDLVEDYDVVHVHGVPHYGILEVLENVKNKGVKIVNTAHSSVKQEFLAQYEAAEKGKTAKLRKEYKALKRFKDRNILNNPSPFGDTYWGSAIFRQEKIMTLADSVQHMNEAYKNDIIDEYSAEENAHKHTVIPNGVKTIKGTVERPRKKRIMFMGRFAKDKGIDEFVDALPGIFEQHPDAEVKFVGGDKSGRLVGRYRNKVKRKLEKHFKKDDIDISKLLRRVHFTGWVTSKKKLQNHFQWTDYVIIPSRAESFSLVASEALMHKRIPIITRTKAMDDLYVSKGVAFGIEEKDRHGEGIAQTVNQILDHDDSKKHHEMAARGRKFVLANYSVDKMIERQLDSYRKLTGPKKKKKIRKHQNSPSAGYRQAT